MRIAVTDARRNRDQTTRPIVGAAMKAIAHESRLLVLCHLSEAGELSAGELTRRIGMGQSATGPFYCPADQLVYLDLGFFDELRSRFGAPGDFAQAYVLAHEVGHHVQRITGIEGQVRQLQQQRPDQQNALSVRLELQADCFAGVWGNSAARSGRAAQGKVELEAGDVEDGLNAAAAIGDDRIQRMSGGRVAPDRFTHGSSEQRVTWFRRGLQSGDMKACDTFQ